MGWPTNLAFFSFPSGQNLVFWEYGSFFSCSIFFHLVRAPEIASVSKRVLGSGKRPRELLCFGILLGKPHGRVYMEGGRLSGRSAMLAERSAS